MTETKLDSRWMLAVSTASIVLAVYALYSARQVRQELSLVRTEIAALGTKSSNHDLQPTRGEENEARHGNGKPSAGETPATQPSAVGADPPRASAPSTKAAVMSRWMGSRQELSKLCWSSAPETPRLIPVVVRPGGPKSATQLQLDTAAMAHFPNEAQTGAVETIDCLAKTFAEWSFDDLPAGTEIRIQLARAD